MKKLFAFLLIMTLFLSSALWVRADETLIWEGKKVEVQSLQESELLKPGDMKSTEYAVKLILKTDEALWKDKEMSQQLYRDSALKDKKGQLYSPSASAVGTNEPTFLYLFAIPKELDISELTYVLKGAEAAPDAEDSAEEDVSEDTEAGEEAEESNPVSSRPKLSASDKKNAVWTRAEFENLLDCSFRDFKPEKPKANAYFFIVADESQSFPKTIYAENLNEEEKSHLRKAIRSLQDKLEKDPAFEKAVFVHDPDQASYFLELNFQYVYNTRYYEGKASFEGYDCELTIRVLHAGSKIEITRMSGKNKLPLEVDVGDTPDGGDFCADPPGPEKMADLPLLTEALEKLNELKMRRDEVLKTTWTDENKEELVKTLLAYDGAFGDGPWSQAICEAGAEDVQLTKEAVTFSLRSFNPKVKDIAEDQPAGDWILQAMENASAYDLEMTLPLKEGKFSKAALGELEDKLAQAAREAEEQFASNRFNDAFCDWFYPHNADNSPPSESPLWENLKASLEEKGNPSAKLELDEILPFFLAQKELRLEVADGPHALRFSGLGANPEVLLQQAKDKTYAFFTTFPRNEEQGFSAEREFKENLKAMARNLDGVSNTDEDNEPSEEEKRWENYAFRLDIDQLDVLPDDYLAYIGRYAYKDYEEPLVKAVYDWQHMPELPFPRSGWLSGSQSGTLLNIYAPSDGRGRYIQIRRSWDGGIALTAFINAGHMISVYVPEGSYYFQVAAGETWYGYEELFGDQGLYGKSDVFQVKNSNYYHDIRLQASEGNLGSQPTSKDAFRP